MIVVILPGDNMVIVDGEMQNVDCSSVAADIYHVQWDGARGTIEFHNNPDDPDNFKGNESFNDFTPFLPLFDAWQAAHSLAVAAAQANAHKAMQVSSVTQSYNSSLRRAAVKAEAKGDLMGAVKLLMKAR